MRFADRLPGFEQSDRVMKWFSAPLVAIDKTNQESCASDPRMQLLEHGKVLRNKLRFENEILRRITVIATSG